MKTILLRRDTAHNWERSNPVLGRGEPGYEINTGKLKIGDGVSKWMDLDFFIPGNFNPNPDGVELSQQDLINHENAELPHPVYDDGPSLILLYQNAKV